VSIDERQRLALHEAAKESWGAEVAVTLMEMLPPAGWADVATKQDIELMRAALHVDLADLRTTTERALRTSLMWTITTMVASVGAVAAVVGLIG
jgi:hypothetical protein